MSTAFANKFAVLSDSKKSKLASETAPKSAQQKKASPKQAAPKPAAKAAAKPAAAAAKGDKAPSTTKSTAGAVSDAPTDLRAAAEYNRKKAEELAARKAAEEVKKAEAKAAAEAAKKAAEEAAAAAAAEAAAKGETAEGAEASAEGDALKPRKPKSEEPQAEVLTMDAFNKQRAESKFVVGQKAARTVDTKAFEALQKVKTSADEIVIKKADAKPAAKPAAKGAKAKPVTAPVRHEKKEVRAEKIDLSQFGAPADAGRGRGRGGFPGTGRGFGGGFSGRGGYRGGDRVPNMEDKRAFPALA